MTDEVIMLRMLVEENPDADLLRDSRLFRPAADGTGGRRTDRRRPRQEELRAPCSAHRLPRPWLGDPRRYHRTAHPQLRRGSCFPAFVVPHRMAEKASPP
jgi:hypothetical protein